MQTEYPEHEKLKKVADESQTCGEFLDWLKHEKGFVLHEWNERLQEYVVAWTPINTMLAEFFEIDQDRLEAEKRTMLEEIRRINERS